MVLRRQCAGLHVVLGRLVRSVGVVSCFALCGSPHVILLLLLLARRIVDRIERIAMSLFLRCIAAPLWHFLWVLSVVSVGFGYGGRILASSSASLVLSVFLVLFSMGRRQGSASFFLCVPFSSSFPFRRCERLALCSACRRICNSGVSPRLLAI